MAGRKQHYIPQCFLRGFEASRSGKNTQVFVFRHGREPYLSGISDVAAQRDFYSGLPGEGQKTLDDVITEYENRLGNLLRDLRSIELGQPIPSWLAAEVVSHLTIRTMSVRDLFGLGAEELISGASSFLGDSEVVRQYLKIDSTEPDPLIVEEIDKAIDRALPGLASAACSALKRVLMFRLRESFSEEYGKHLGTLMDGIEPLVQSLPKIVRDGHTKALSNAVVPEVRVRALADFYWTKIGADSGKHFVLPDCIAMARSNGGTSEYMPYFLHSNDEVAVIVMPLSTTELLIGCRNAETPKVDAVAMNRFAAKCAFDFFVASKCDTEMLEAATLIGVESKASGLTSVRESLCDLISPKHVNPAMAVDAPKGRNPLSDEEETFRAHSYLVSFRDCADQATATRIAEVVRIIVDQFSMHMPVRRIESITFASNYEQALADIDRGFHVSNPLTSTSVEYGVGVAMAPLVLRDNGIRCCIVMRSWIGQALLSNEDEADWRSAVHILGTMVARAAYIDMVDNALPGVLLKPLDDPWAAFFLTHIESVSSNYFSARSVAGINPELSGGYQELFRNALNSAFETIPLARLDYKSHLGLDAFLSVAMSRLSDVLAYGATVIGHCDGLGESLTDDEETRLLLARRGLRGWCDVYQRDLETVYCRRGRWESLTDFLSLAIHLERLLWEFDIFPWRTDDNQVRVEIPLESDLARKMAGPPPF